MKTSVKPSLFILFFFLISMPHMLPAQNEVIIVEGLLRDAQTHDRIANAAISVPGTPIGTVSNADGEFIIKIAKSPNIQHFVVSHISYTSKTLLIADYANTKKTISLEPQIVQLSDVQVMPSDPRAIVKSAYSKIKNNYSLLPNMMKGFYRESIRQKRDYISITEALIDIYKYAYDDARDDQVSITKGRKGTNVKKADTLNVLLQGGPTVLLWMDVAKNPAIGIDLPEWENYFFKYIDLVNIDNKPNFVIQFVPIKKQDNPLFFGKIYIQRDNYAISRVEFNMDLADEDKAASMFITKKPQGSVFVPTYTNYVVNYKQQGDKYYLSYIRIELKFKSDWKRKLFKNNYTIISEMAVTDRKEDEIAKIPVAERFKPTMIMSKEVGSFYDQDFWGADNIIEPEEAIENAIRRITKKMGN